MLNIVVADQNDLKNLKLDTQTLGLRTFKDLTLYLNSNGYVGKRFEYSFNGEILNENQALSAYLINELIMVRVIQESVQGHIEGLFRCGTLHLNITNFYVNSNITINRGSIVEDTSNKVKKIPQLAIQKPIEQDHRSFEGNYSIKLGKRESLNKPIETKMEPKKKVKQDNNMLLEERKNKIMNNSQKNTSYTQECFKPKEIKRHNVVINKIEEEELLISSESESEDIEVNLAPQKPSQEPKYMYRKMEMTNFKDTPPYFLMNTLLCFREISFDKDGPAISGDKYAVILKVTKKEFIICDVLNPPSALMLEMVNEKKSLGDKAVLVFIKDSNGFTNHNNKDASDKIISFEIDINKKSHSINFDNLYSASIFFNKNPEQPFQLIIPQKFKEMLFQGPSQNPLTEKNKLSKLDNLVGKQINYYFSDKNYFKDKFILDKVEKDEDNGMSIDDLLTFNRIKNFKVDKETLTDILKRYTEANNCTFKFIKNGKLVKKQVVN